MRLSFHEQLLVLVDANACTWKRGSGRIGGAYGRETLDYNGERLLTFASNHDLALVNIFCSTRKSSTPRTFNGHKEEKQIDYIFTRHRDRKLARDVKVHRRPNFLPISDHNIVADSVRLLGRFNRNRRVWTVRKRGIDLQCLTTDSDIGR